MYTMVPFEERLSDSRNLPFYSTEKKHTKQTTSIQGNNTQWRRTLLSTTYLIGDLGVHGGHGAVVQNHGATGGPSDDDGIHFFFGYIVAIITTTKVQSKLRVEEARIGVVVRDHDQGQIGPVILQLHNHHHQQLVESNPARTCKK